MLLNLNTSRTFDKQCVMWAMKDRDSVSSKITFHKKNGDTISPAKGI